MPYSRRSKDVRRRKTFSKNYKKKSYYSRLKDKKINTTVERRALEISKGQDEKDIPYYSTRGTWLLGNAQFPLNDTYPALADCPEILNTAFWVHEFGKVGGYLNSNISDAVAAQPAYDAREMKIHLKLLKVSFDFLNEGVEPAQVDMCIWRFPYNKHLLSTNAAPGPTVNPQPQWMHHKPFTNFNSITREAVDYHQKDADNVQSTKTLLAHKRILVYPNRQIDDPAAGGANRLNTRRWKNLTMSKNYKGLGFGEKYELEDQQVSPIGTAGSMSNHRYYLSIRVDNTVRFRGVSIVKFCKGKNIPLNLIFDRGAPGLIAEG